MKYQLFTFAQFNWFSILLMDLKEKKSNLNWNKNIGSKLKRAKMSRLDLVESSGLHADCLVNFSL